MPTTLESIVTKYLRSGSPAQRTREEYATTLRKWSRWGGAVPLENLGRKEICEFLDWVHEDAVARHARNPGRTSNKVRSHLRAVMSWAWEQYLDPRLNRQIRDPKTAYIGQLDSPTVRSSWERFLTASARRSMLNGPVPSLLAPTTATTASTFSNSIKTSGGRMVGRVLRHRSVGTTMRGLLVWVVLAEGMARLDAADVNWRNPAGGSFSSTGSWFGGGVPGSSDVAHFGLTPPPNPPALPPDPISYTVSFASNERTAGIDVLDDQVTFDLNGTTYSVGNTFGVQVGSGSGTSGRLTISDGQVRQVFAQLPVIIGQNSGNGGLAVLTAGQLHSGEQALIGFAGVGSATVAGTGALWNHFGEITVGAQAPGTLNVSDRGFVRSTSSVVGSAGAGSANVAGTGSKWESVGGLSVGKNATGMLNISAGGFVGAALSFLTPEFNASGPIQIAGVTPSVTGTVNVDGAGSTLYVSDMSVGAIGVGTLSVTGGGLVQNGRLGSSSSEIVTASIGTSWSSSTSAATPRSASASESALSPSDLPESHSRSSRSWERARVEIRRLSSGFFWIRARVWSTES